MPTLPAGLRDLLGELAPGSEVISAVALPSDSAAAETLKAEGYGAPIRVLLREPGGGERNLVFHTARSNPFGHDRRADRAEQQLLDFDDFPLVPDHARAIDVGAIMPGGKLTSLRDAGEFYLVSEWVEGSVYADDLRRLAAGDPVCERDLARAEALARWAARLHATRVLDPERYRRAVRDLLGHGEGIFGMVDGYPDGVPSASPERLRHIEERSLAWRWRLRGRESRLSRTHGDFHPFNVVFPSGGGTSFKVLDASRGCVGDPADDVTAMAVNYVFFAASRPQAWHAGLSRLWWLFWSAYLEESSDEELVRVLAPWLAWRCLVVSSPRFYPRLPAPARDRMLTLAERALAEDAFDPAWAGELFR
ncbi:MAG TPA: aminoglycoside phosphotransferase family protein [Anaeromyxobacteraceae bacterium]|nr:aminoglycoside phosphotransferase family protein [Anaeromyxobacteraceae bacterium]